ncbi:MAG: gamma-glutamyltransferase [Chloroflexi bacterium]|nr:gamma-glutamyltransferase [Chloroflexota bacterium]
MNVTNWAFSKNEAVSDHGMVAAKHPLAAEAGLQVLKEGGNAVDAAITTALTMGVLEPAMNGVGGGGFMVYHNARTGTSSVVDYFMPAPGKATPDMYEIVNPGAVDTLGFRGVKNDENIIGYRSIAVPGMVKGAAVALEKFGTISLRRALEPAIKYAEEGYPTTWFSMLTTAGSMEALMRFPATAAIYLKQGKLLYTAGRGGDQPERVVNADLAKVLKRIYDQGVVGFYGGETAEMIVKDLNAHGNVMSLDDLANYQPKIRQTRSTTYRGDYTLIYAPSTGGGTLAETFNILEGIDFSGLDPKSPEALHLFVEAARIAYADRWQHLADEDFIDVPWQVLESKAYAATRRKEIDPRQAAKEIKPYSPATYKPGTPEPDGGCTTHLSVIDKYHNMVAITQTINEGWGSKVVVPGTGILFNDSMVLLDPNPGRANSISPGKRGVSSMTPTLVLKRGKPYMSVGAPGGRQIMGTVMKVIHNVIDYGMGIQDACATLSVDASAAKLQIDKTLGEDVLAGLAGRGHTLDVREKGFSPRPFASPTGILVDDEGKVHGGADPLHIGIAVGY